METEISSSELYAILKLSLRSASQSRIDTDTALFISHNEVPSGERPGLRKLIEGILYSRRFILSYQLVLLALLLCFSVLHWGSRFRNWRKRKLASKDIRTKHSIPHQTLITKNQEIYHVIEEIDSGKSSSNATLQGSPCSPKALSIDARENEQTPLLAKSNRSTAPSWISALIYNSRAWLVYQPRPIPYINKSLPSNRTTIAVLIFVALQVFYSLWNIPFSLSMLFIFADRTALVFIANLPLLYLFAAKNQPIKALTGYSYESLNIFHRRLGEVMCLLALLHSVGMIGVWYTILKPSGLTLARFLLSKIIMLGIGAFVAYETLYFTSLGSFRQRWYELFLGIHVALQVIALVLVWFHHSTSRLYVAAALAIYLVDRLLYRMGLKSGSWRASLHVKEDQETVVLWARIPLTEKNYIFQWPIKSSIGIGWKAMEHIFVTIPALSPKHIMQAHPFTIASRAPLEGDSECILKLIIRAQDGFSRDLRNYARSHDAATVRLDGPYGSQTAVELLQNSDLSIIVAGGSGIAVTWPLVWSLISDSRVHDLECSGTAAPTKRILFVWVVRSQSHLSWLEDGDLEALEAEGIYLVVPPPTADCGHPSITGLITEWLETHERSVYQESAKIGVVCSGPDAMNRDVRNMCSSWLQAGLNVNVEIEKFGW